MEPSTLSLVSEQLGPTGVIERFTAIPGRTDIGFRDDNYDGSIRPAYFIEFIYDGVSPLSIQSDSFERRDPEPVRNLLDIELALFNEAGDLLAVDDDDSDNEFDVLNLDDIDPSFLFNGNLPAGRYFVAASAFATEFEDGFVVNTNNNQTGTLNVTISNGADFVAPVVGRDLTQQPSAPLIVTGGEDVGDIEDGEPDGSVVLSAQNGGAILLAETDLNDVRELTVNEAVGIVFTDADDAIIISNNTETFEFVQFSVGRAGNGGVLDIGGFAADEALLQADSGIVTSGELDIPRLLIGGPQAIDSGGDIALISPNTEELAFQFVNDDTDFALATNQDLVIGAFESQSGVLIDGSIGDEIRIQANSLTISSGLEATTQLVVEVQETLTQGVSTEDSSAGIITDSLFFTGTTLNLSDVNNEIGQIAAETTEGDFQLQSTLPTQVSNLDNSIDVGELPSSESLSFNEFRVINGVNSATDLTFDVLNLTQDVGAILQGRELTITTTGGVGDQFTEGFLPTGPEVDNGTLIDNDVDPSIPGSFQATVGNGNEVTTSSLTFEELDGTITTGDLVFDYLTFARVGDTTINLATQATITQPATLIAEDVVQSIGTFDGPNGLVTFSSHFLIID